MSIALTTGAVETSLASRLIGVRLADQGGVKSGLIKAEPGEVEPGFGLILAGSDFEADCRAVIAQPFRQRRDQIALSSAKSEHAIEGGDRKVARSQRRAALKGSHRDPDGVARKAFEDPQPRDRIGDRRLVDAADEFE